MPKPRIGDELRWTDGSEWEIVGPCIDGRPGYRWRAHALCLKDPDLPHIVGTQKEVVFQRETVEESGWKYIEDEFTRWVRETREEHGKTEAR